MSVIYIIRFQSVNPSVPIDMAATMLLQECALQMDMVNSDIASRPVPHLFTSNIPDLTAIITANSEKVFQDLQWIYSHFFVPENLPAYSALDHIARPR